jgi:hypothetical protein
LQLDPREAAAVAIDELRAGRRDLLAECLNLKPVRLYAKITAQLGVCAIDDPTARLALIAYLQAQFTQRDPAFAAGALCVLDKLDPGTLPDLLLTKATRADLRDPLATLLAAARSDAALYHVSVRSLLLRHVAHADPRVWQPCLDALMRSDPQGALDACRASLSRSDSGPITYLVATYRHEGALPLVLALSAENPVQRRQVLQALQPALGLTPKRVALLESSPAPLADLLFPRAMRPDEPEQAKLQIAEALHAPDTSITGVRITAWIYQQAGRPSDIVVAGHATPKICGRVTSHLFNALLTAGRGIDAGALLVSGAFLLRAPARDLSPSPLEQLRAMLEHLAESTGLVQIGNARQPDYDAAVASLRDQIAVGLRAGTPVIMPQAAPSGPSSGVLMPFFLFGDMQPLSFTLPVALFGERELDSLLQQHYDRAAQEIAEQAKRRQETYQSWLDQDRAQLRTYAFALFTHLLPDDNAETLRSRLVTAFCTDRLQAAGLRQRAQRRYELIRRMLPNLAPRPAEELSDEQLIALSQSLRRNLSPDSLGELDATLTADLWDWIEAQTRPTSSPAKRLAHGRPIKKQPAPALPSGQLRQRRDYPQAHIEIGSALPDASASLLELIEIGLPNLIQLDTQWLERQRDQVNGEQGDRDHTINDKQWLDRQLGQIDAPDARTQREMNFQAINLNTLLDPFLRGWPPVFLSDAERRAEYTAWCAARRKPVWEAIHAELLKRGAQVHPLTSDNVIFAARRIGDRIEITPYVVTTDQECMILLRPEVGMTWYVYPWQYRETTYAPQPADKRAAASAAVAEAELALAAEGVADEVAVAGAVAHYTRALRIHPVRALKEICQLATAMRRDNHEELLARLPLAQEIDKFTRNHILPARDVLDNALASYPLFVAEPYLFQALSADPQAESLAITGRALRESRQRFGELDDRVTQRFGDSPDMQKLGEFLAAPQQEHASLAQQVRELRKVYQATEQEIWHRLWERHDPPMYLARMLDPQLFAQLKSSSYRPSRSFRRYFDPVLTYQRALAYIDLVHRLRDHYAAVGDHGPSTAGKASARRDGPQILLQAISAVMEDSANEPQIKATLGRLSDELSAPSPGWRGAFSDAITQIAARTYDLLHAAAQMAPELTSIHQALVDHAYDLSFYQIGVEHLIGDMVMPLICSLQFDRYQILDPGRAEVRKLSFERPTQTIFIHTSNNERRPVLRFEGLVEEDARYLASELTLPYVVERLTYVIEQLKPTNCRHSPAYALLMVPLTPPPRILRRQTALANKDLLSSLVMAIAYFRPPRHDEAAQDLAEARYDGEPPVIERISFSAQAAYAQALRAGSPST